MLVSKQHKTLILKLRHPGKVVGVVPGAWLSKRWPDVVYVPHNPDTTAILRNLGMKRTPSPITYDYDWPGRFTPYEHQVTTSNFLVGHKRAFCLNGLGSGKTNSILWALDYLMKQGLVRKALIISPLSTLERVWGDALFTDLYHRKYAVLHGTADRRLKLFRDTKFDFYVINPDGLGIIFEDLKRRKDIDAIVIDEATSMKNTKATRWKMVDAVLKASPPAYFWMSTGTPTPNDPTEAYGLAKLMGTHQDMSYTRFRDATMRQVTQYKWAPREGCEQIVQAVLSPAVRFKTDECIDLPPCTHQMRQCELTSTQKKQLAQMKKTYAMEAQGHVIDAVNAADKINKMLQTVSGFSYLRDANDERTAIRLEIAPRLALLREILEEVEGKVIVFVPFVELVTILKEELAKVATVEVIDGSVSAGRRNVIFNDFQHTSEPRILLAHPKTMAHGLTLTSAATIVWYAPYPSNEVYEQANARINRPSQMRSTTIFHLLASSLEKDIYDKLKSRQHMQNLLLEYVKAKEM